MFDDKPTDQKHNTINDGTGGISVPPLSLGDNPVAPQTADSPVSSAPTTPTVVLPSQATDTTAAPGTTAPASTPAPGSLEEMKHKALEQLSPLVNHLEQTPEEKYKTLMMMIQASDNQDLLGEAYENAQKITDDKAKAEALLNIVNEINYFTQKQASS